MAMLIPLTHSENLLENFLKSEKRMCQSPILQFGPPKQTPWRRPWSHLMPGDHFPFWKFEHGTCNFSSWSWGSFGHIWHELMDFWGNYLAMVSQDIQDMLQRSHYVGDVGAWKDHGKKIILYTNHYQSKFWYLAMITQTFKCNFGASCLIIRHLSIWITSDCIHCSLPSQLPKLAKSGDMTSSIAMYSVMRDHIHDTRRVWKENE